MSMHSSYEGKGESMILPRAIKTLGNYFFENLLSPF